MNSGMVWVWVLVLIGGVVFGGVFPGEKWEVRRGGEVGLDEGGLDAVRDYLGGQGCVVRHGYMVYTWGGQGKRQDVASAVKPLYTHFLLKAVEEGKLSGVDELVGKWEPRLNGINAGLGYKDRKITFRHMANQVSCYGVSERPGEAYDYNDWQMALFFDTLMLKVYGCSGWGAIDGQVLRPGLTDAIGCEDEPSFMAFGTGNRPGRFRVSVRDFARFGLLYLNEGNWNGRQVVGREHARLAVASSLRGKFPRTKAVKAEMIAGQRSIGSRNLPDDQTDHFGSYSFAWWTNGVGRDGKRHWPDAPVDVYGAFGHKNGQRAVVVLPSLDMVISWNDTTLGNRGGNPVNEALKLLVGAVRDARRGPIVVDREHPAQLKYAGGGSFYMCGPGDPEGFLYRGKRNADGTRDGDQRALIGKMTGTGANCIYMQAIRSHGGDGDATHNPFVDSDVNKPLDEDILRQWADWFELMDDNGITIYLFLYDDSALPFARPHKGGEPDAREKRFIDGIVGRFKGLRNLIWCVAEEYAERLSKAHALKIAERIRRKDGDHAIAIHQNHGTSFDFEAGGVFDQFAVQWNEETAEALHEGAVAAWADTGGKVNINMSEFAGAGTGGALRKKIWAIAMGGAYSMILDMDIASTPVEDLETCGRLVRFMESVRFAETQPSNNLARGDTDYVLAAAGQVYIAYGDAGKSFRVIVKAGKYGVKWYDVADGRWVDAGVRTLGEGPARFEKPDGVSDEAVVYLVKR